MPLFYTSKFEGLLNHKDGSESPLYCHLQEGESAHCSKVLRMRVGDTIEVTDGMGHKYEAILQEVGLKNCVAEITKTLKTAWDGGGEREEIEPSKIHIIMAPTKQIERVEWFLEKATEIGIGHITLIQTHRTERNRIPEERLERILVSAMKQSMQCYKPILSPFINWETFLTMPCNNKNISVPKYIAYCGLEYERKEFAQELQSKKDFLKDGIQILIGPEGDFTNEEVSQIVSLGYTPVVLGANRLRAETAALYACTAANLALL